MLQAKHVVLQEAFREQDLRLDGEPRAAARREHPGVILSFESKHGPMSYPCDTFDNYTHNVRAIALGLEALRKVARYGIANSGEQYTGYRALGGTTDHDSHARPMTLEEAAGFLFMMSGTAIKPQDLILGNQIGREAAYRSAAKRLHPDVGGSTETFQKLQEAKRILDGVR
jgi:hypothetical protein